MILINELYKNKRYYSQIAFRVVKRHELAEEVIQLVAIKLLSIKDEILNIKNFIAQVVFHQALNMFTTHKRFDFDAFDMILRAKDYNNGEVHLLRKTSVNRIKQEVYKLPPKQQTALRRWFGIDCDIDRKPKKINYDTNKLNSRWGILSLRKKLNKEDFYFYENKN